MKKQDACAAAASAPRGDMPAGRLASLDILRGADLFLLVFFQPVLLAVGQQLDVPWLNAVLTQFDHEVWEGFRFWDLVMPLFLFMTGVSMPFSLGKYAGGGATAAVWVKVVRRFVVLFLLGMVVQGNLLWFRPEYFQYYSNTLQAIASGYLIAAVLLLTLGRRGQVAAVGLLLLAYWLPMTFCGDFTPEGSFANRVDALLLGAHRGDATYTWVWSSLTFGVTVMLGAFAGQMMRGATDRQRAARRLLLTGLALVAAGWLWGWQMPVVKRLWTCSMALLSGGYCFLLMAAFYWWVDCKGRSRGLTWLKFYGMNSITAYMLGEVVNFRSIPRSLLYGLEPWLGEWYGVLLTLCNFLILFFILRCMYRSRVFLKI